MKTMKQKIWRGQLRAACFAVFMLLFAALPLHGQITIMQDACSSATTGWTFTNNVTSQPIQQSAGGGYWLLQASGSSKDYAISASIDVSNYINLTLEAKVATYGSGTNNPLLVEYSLDGGSTWATTKFTSATPTSGSTYINAFSPAADLGTLATTQLKLRFSNGGTADKGVRLQSIVLKGEESGTVEPDKPIATVTGSTEFNADIREASFSGSVAFEFNDIAQESSSTLSVVSGTNPAPNFSISSNTTVAAGTSQSTVNFTTGKLSAGKYNDTIVVKQNNVVIGKAAINISASDPSLVPTYDLVTNSSQLVAGNKYIIAGAVASGTYMGFHINGDYYSGGGLLYVQYSSSTSAPNEIILENGSGAVEMNLLQGTIAGTDWLFQMSTGAYSGQYIGSNGSSNGLTISSIGKQWTITPSSGATTITCNGTGSSGTANQLKLNPQGYDNAPAFRCYGSGQNAIYLYRKREATPVLPDPTVELMEVEEGKGSFSGPTENNVYTVNLSNQIETSYNGGLNLDNLGYLWFDAANATENITVSVVKGLANQGIGITLDESDVTNGYSPSFIAENEAFVLYVKTNGTITANTYRDTIVIKHGASTVLAKVVVNLVVNAVVAPAPTITITDPGTITAASVNVTGTLGNMLSAGTLKVTLTKAGGSPIVTNQNVAKDATTYSVSLSELTSGLYTLDLLLTRTSDGATQTATVNFTVDLPNTANVSFSPEGGNIADATNVSLTSTTAGAKIYYTLDGSDPKVSGMLYSSAIPVTEVKTTIKAYAIAEGYDTSDVTSATYTRTDIVKDVVFAPYLVEGYKFIGQTKVTMRSETEGTSIYYTTAGGEPTEASTEYSSPITLSATSTINAKAFKDGDIASGVSTSTYTSVDPAKVNIPYNFGDKGVADLTADKGYVANGIGSDLPDAGARINFDNEGDELILAYNNIADKLTFTGRTNGSGNKFEGTMTVDASTNGYEFSNVETMALNFPRNNDDLNKEINLPLNARYIRFKYESKVLGNIGLGNISLSAFDCAEPVLNAAAVTKETAELSWEGATEITEGYEVRFAESEGGVASAELWTVSKADTIIENLTASTQYYYSVKAICSGSRTSDIVTGNFTTSSLTAPVLRVASPAAAQKFDSTAVKFEFSVENFDLGAAGEAEYNGSIEIKVGNAAVVLVAETEYWYTGLVSGNYTATFRLVDGAGNPLATDVVVTRNFSVDLPNTANVAFSVAGGDITEPVDVVLSSATPGAKIYYTTSGNSFTEYLAAVRVGDVTSTTIKAYAIAPGYDTSDITSATYNRLATLAVISPAAAQKFDSTAVKFEFEVEHFILGVDGVIEISLNGGAAEELSETEYWYTGLVSGDYTYTVKLVNNLDEILVTKTDSFSIDLKDAATPTFANESGVYMDSVLVKIECSTAGATILYALNDDEYIVYSDTFYIKETSVVKAKAAKAGMDTGTVATVTYTIEETETVVIPVANLRELRDIVLSGDYEDNIYKITGEVVVTATSSNRNQHWVQDTSAGILIDEHTEAHNIGVGITGMTGTVRKVNELVHFYVSSSEISSNDNEVDTIVLTNLEYLADIEKYESRLIRVNALTWGSAGSFSEGNRCNLTCEMGYTVYVHAAIHDADYIGEEIPYGKYDIIGLAGRSNDDAHITPRSLSDMIKLDAVNVCEDNVVAAGAGLSVYPNPSNGMFNIKVALPSVVTIFNAAGVKLRELNVNETAVVNSLGSGMYVLRAVDATGKTSSERVIIIK